MRKLALFSAAFAAAAAIYVYLLQDLPALLLAGISLVGSVLCRRLQIRRASLLALGLAVGLLWCHGYETVWLSGVTDTSSTEQFVALHLQEAPVKSGYSTRLTGRVEFRERAYNAVLYTSAPLTGLRVGDTVSGLMIPDPAPPTITDEESLYLRSRDIQLRLYASDPLTVTAGTPSLPARLQSWLQSRIHALYSGETAGLVRALLTGDRSELDYGVQNALSVAGLSHAFAVSGMHVSILLSMVALLSLGNPRLTAGIGIPVFVLFACLTGLSPSVCRAAFMQILLLSAPMVRRQRDTQTSLGAAALLLLLQNPWAIASVSFQLSFAAVLGLGTVSGPIYQRICACSKQPGRLLQAVASSVSATLGASMLTVPLSVLYFGLASIVAPLTNLLCLWAVTGIFMLGLFSCLLGSLGAVPAWIAAILCRYVLWVCRTVSGFPYAAAYPDNLPLLIWTLCAYGCLILLLLLRKKLPVYGILSVLTAAFLFCLCWGRWSLTGGQWQFRAQDVGQGQCLILQQDDFTAVIDCGGSNPQKAGEQAARVLHGAGITSVDALILTHYDADHTGGVPQLMERIQVQALFLPDTSDNSGLRQALETAGPQVIAVTGLTELALPNGSLRIFPSVPGETDNNSGICILATVDEYDILITGDLDHTAELQLLQTADLPDVDLLVAGHHGAADSTCQPLLRAVQPETVIISVGANNIHGHPAPQTLARIEAAGAEILRTDLEGTVILSDRR